MKPATLIVAAALGVGAPALASAQDAQPFVPAPPPAATGSGSTAASSSGVAVVALERATDAAWPLAQAIYGDSGLRPATIDDATARVLAGEAPRADAPLRLRELADVRAALRGDDTASRRLLASLARDLGVTAIAVVARGESAVTCRLFLASTGQMDVVTLSPDGAEGPITWSGAVEALRARVARRLEGPRAESPPTSGPPASAKTDEPKSNGSFLSSKWFWGAAIAAGVVGVFFLASRPSSSSTDPTTVQLHGHVAP